jgi:hypothetical protein
VRDRVVNPEGLSFIDAVLLHLANTNLFEKGPLRNALMMEGLPKIRWT